MHKGRTFFKIASKQIISIYFTEYIFTMAWLIPESDKFFSRMFIKKNHGYNLVS